MDPSRLLQSAERIYGDQMGPLWGGWCRSRSATCTCSKAASGSPSAGELDVEYTPGHASHHVVYFDRGDGTAYVGDVAGVRIPPADYVRAPTPPPDIDVEAWQRSIDLVAARGAARGWRSRTSAWSMTRSRTLRG